MSCYRISGGETVIYKIELDFVRNYLEKELEVSGEDTVWNGKYLKDLISDYFKVEDPFPILQKFVNEGILVLQDIYDGDSNRNIYRLNTEKLDAMK